MEEVRIRDFIPEDIEKLLIYREESGRISFPGLTINREREIERIREHVAKHPRTIMIAETGGRMAGYIRFHINESSFGDYAIIDAIFVDNEQREKGIGKLLLEAAERRLLSMGINNMEAAVTNSNIHSLKFFRSRGYEEKRTVFEKKLSPS